MPTQSKYFKIGLPLFACAALGWFAYEQYFKNFVSENENVMNKIDVDFNACMNQVFKNEGFVSNLKTDTGGYTKFGISSKWHPEVDVPNLTKEEALEIYKNEYWSKIPDIDTINDLQIKYQLFDSAVNCGVSVAVKWSKYVSEGVDYLKRVRIAYYNLLVTNKPTNKDFLKGWINRVNKIV